MVIGEGAATSDAVVPADATNGLLTNPSDRAARDMGKIDIAAFDVALPVGTNWIGTVALATGATVTITSTGSVVSVKQYDTWNIGTVTSITNSVTINTAATGAVTVTVSSSGSTVAASQYGTWTVGLSSISSVALVNSVGGAVQMGNGAAGAAVPRVTLANDSTGVVGLSQGFNWIGTVALASSSTISITSTGSTVDGAIVDGAASSIRASVLDYSNSNPLAVRLSDTNGDYVAAGAGTQYTEDAAAAADPVGGALMLVRSDSLSGQVSGNGDNVAARGSDTGALWVQIASAGSIAAAQSGTWNVGLSSGTNWIGTIAIASGTSISLNSNGTLAVVGNVASGATDSGNPVKVGGKYNATLPSITDGQRADIQATSNGTVAVTVLPLATGYGWTPIMIDGLQASSVVTVPLSANPRPIALGGYYIYNPNSSVAYVQMFNTNGTVTLGGSTPKLSLGIPATSAANLTLPVPIDFNLGLKVAATTVSSGATNPTTALTANFWYR